MFQPTVEALREIGRLQRLPGDEAGCWAFMAALIAVGLMNVAAMVVLITVVLLEKTWERGRALRVGLGVAALVLAVAVAFQPSLAAGLYQVPDMRQMPGTPMGSP